MIIKILLLLLLIIINGIFSATEIAFLSLNKYELKKEIKKGNKKAIKIRDLLNDSSTFLSAIQIAITLSGFLASAFAAESFASEISEKLNISFIDPESLTNILVILITLILSYITLVFGELVPKKIGLAYSKKIAFSMVEIINTVIKVFKPFIFILRVTVDFFTRILKIKKQTENSEEELKNNIIDSELEELEKNLLFNVFEFNDTTLKQIMTPINEAIFIDTSDNKETIIEKLKTYKYTRFPVIENEKIIGVINIKDMILNRQEGNTIKKYIRNLIPLNSNMVIDDAFLLLRSKHEAMAKVIENKECIGIITMEDIVEEIVGEIYDEYDDEPNSNQ